jgi:hypothetical protein
MNRGMEAMGGRVVKKYRLYERVFEVPPVTPVHSPDLDR